MPTAPAPLPVVPPDITLAIPPPTATVTSTAARKCPFCAEGIKAAAFLCKHCGRFLGAPGARLSGGGHPNRLAIACVVIGVLVGLMGNFIEGGLFLLLAVVLFVAHGEPAPAVSGAASERTRETS